VVSHTHQPVGDRVPPSRCTSAFRQVHHGAGDPAAACRFTRPSLARLMWGEAVIPRPVVRGPLCFPGHAPPYLPGSFGHATADYVDRPHRRRWGPVIGWERRRVRPVVAPPPLRALAGDPTPITQVKVRARAKSTTGFSLSKPVPGFKSGYRFSGCRLTSLQ